MTPSRQTIIPMVVAESNGFDSFFSEDNAQLIDQLKILASGQRSRRVLYLYGASGSGKSHLLHTFGEVVKGCGKKHLHLTVNPLDNPFDSLAVSERDAYITVDGFERIESLPDCQRSLLTLFEQLTNHSGVLLVASAIPLTQFTSLLPDLSSRLSLGGVYCLRPLGENAKREALQAAAERRGFELPDSVVNFILTHYERDSTALFSLLDRIDNSALAEQRSRITIPFVRKLIGSD
ncbi:MAG: DnaA/Hda family protein [Pseudomonadota bacterium]